MGFRFLMGEIMLRPYQQASKDAVFEKWSEGTKRTLLVLPTGTGKTIVFAAITEECVRKGERVLILAHRGELLEQAADKIKKSTGLGCSVEKAEQTCIGSWFRVTVGSVQTLMRDKRLKKRRDEGLASPKQIRQLEQRGFKNVASWSWEQARRLIDRIAANGWKTPRDIQPALYRPPIIESGNGELDW